MSEKLVEKKPMDKPIVDEDDRDDSIIGVALVWSGIAIVIGLLIASGVTWWALQPAPIQPTETTDLANVDVRHLESAEVPTATFTDITEQAGIRFTHENGFSEEKLLPETMGGGCAFLDFDNDGDVDILLINSKRWPWDAGEDAATQATMALYANDGDGNFTEVTEGSGLDIPCYGMGVAVGDFDNDGLCDIFVSALGPNLLFHNQGDGQFKEISESAGVKGADDAWGSSCGWFDYDNDGDLDLLVLNYLTWSRKDDIGQNFQLTGGGRAYGRPMNFAGALPYLYRNEGDGTFSEAAEEMGLHIRDARTGAAMNKSLGLTFADFDGDGYIDIFVGNDTVQNQLFANQGGKSFRETGELAGIAFDENGNARAAMGVDVAAFRNDKSLGVAIGNFANEMTALYVAGEGDMLFVDEAVSSGLGPNTRLELTFGVLFLDYDLDGRLDLFASNGHLEREINRVQASQQYEQAPQLFWNCGSQSDTEFAPVSAKQCGEDLKRPIVGRGSSYADIDGDGDLDILIAAVGAAPRLLRNDQQLGHNWLRMKLVGSKANRDAIGAWVELKIGDETMRRQVMPTRSYQSQVELPITFGLGEADKVDAILVHWPDGETQQIPSQEINQQHTIVQETAN